jgi:hypothetical protein
MRNYFLCCDRYAVHSISSQITHVDSGFHIESPQQLNHYIKLNSRRILQEGRYNIPFMVLASAVPSYQETNSVDFSPQAKYTDRGLPRPSNLVPTFGDRGCCVVSAADPYGG